MSRIGKQKISVPQNVKLIKSEENNFIVVEGPKGKLEKKFSMKIKVRIENREVRFERCDD